MSNKEDYLILEGVHKYFPGIHALDNVTFSIKQGEVHCLAGENGSGKSTLIKVMSGVHSVDRGTLWIGGEKVHRLSPKKAIEKGIQVIYQDLSLFENLTVVENLTIIRNLAAGKKFVDWEDCRSIAHTILKELNVDIDLDKRVGDLAVAQKQFVAIARSLLFDAKLLIMDEPTTALTNRDVLVFFELVRQIKERGISVLFVSHKMAEMFDISDRVTVLRNGQKVAEGALTDFNERELTYHMTGQQLEYSRYILKAQNTKPRLSLKNYTAQGLQTINFTAFPKEIIGITGLRGCGRNEFCKALFGMGENVRGEVWIDSKQRNISSIASAIESGIAYVPEDRLTEGLFLSQTISTNTLAATLDRWQTLGLYQDKKAMSSVVSMLKKMRVTTPDIRNSVNTLSGGNQQRIVLGKWLLTAAKVLVLNGPTVGVDVGSKAEIHQIIQELAVTQELCVLMFSDDVQELIHNCNRILLMHNGGFVAEFQGKDIDESLINEKLKVLV